MSSDQVPPTVVPRVGLIPFALGIRDGRRMRWLDGNGRNRAERWAFKNPYWATCQHAAGDEAERRANCYQVLSGRRYACIEVVRLGLKSNDSSTVQEPA